jgi:hypothetical protein
MAISYECDICGKTVSSKTREMPADYVSLTFQNYTEKDGFGGGFEHLDICHDCHGRIGQYIEDEKASYKLKRNMISARSSME